MYTYSRERIPTPRRLQDPQPNPAEHPNGGGDDQSQDHVTQEGDHLDEKICEYLVTTHAERNHQDTTGRLTIFVRF